MNIAVLATVFSVTFVAELPDKSLFASLALGVRFRSLPVWLGIAAAFSVHVALAVTAGGLLTLAPRRIVESIVAVLFLAGSVLMLIGGGEEHRASADPANTLTFRRTVLLSFGVIFVGEWGDITQVTTANFAARYNDPLSVAIGAAAGLWLVSALAIVLGTRLLDRIPARLVRLLAAAVFAGFGIYSAIQAATG